MRQLIEELRTSGLEPGERLLILHPTPPDTEDQIRRFYAPSSWPDDGPSGPGDRLGGGIAMPWHPKAAQLLCPGRRGRRG